MLNSIIVGIDTHSKKNALCAIDRFSGEVQRATLPADPSAVIGWIAHRFDPGEVSCVYESGPTGTVLCRALRDAGIDCVIAATSKLPRRTDAQKNDRRDAEWLAKLYIAGSVREVYVPSRRAEALVHLSHLRWARSRELARCRQRVNSFLLLNGFSYPYPGKRWTKRFRAWAASVAFEHEADSFVLRELLRDVDAAEEALACAERAIDAAIDGDERLGGMVGRLRMIHGIGRVTAFALAAEVGDFSRFSRGSQLASYIGLCPSEDSSGDAVRRGRIDRRGNRHLRCLLVECAAVASRPARGPVAAPEGTDPAVADHARKCNDRLCERRRRLVETGVAPCKAKIAVARELAEWVYHIMVM